MVCVRLWVPCLASAWDVAVVAALFKRDELRRLLESRYQFGDCEGRVQW